MAFAGLKKQINKANQYVTEKMGAAEGTKMDDDFVEMERKTDITYELVEELQMKTKEFLQPNPTSRAKMAAVKGISKLSGQAKAATYQQPEGILGDVMTAYGRKLGDESVFAAALVEAGESMKQLADVKYSLDDNVKQNFLEPLHHLQSKDLKEVLHHRKKLHGRRLDFDCKKRKQTKGASFGSPARSPSPYSGSSVTDEEIRQAEEKFAESLHLAQMGMNNILDNDVEQISQLAFFAEGLLEYHNQCTDILKVLTETLHDKRNEAASKPRKEFIPKTLADVTGMSSMGEMSTLQQPGRTTPSSGVGDSLNGMSSVNKTPAVSPASTPSWDPFGNNQPAANANNQAAGRSASRPQPCCIAVYDFEPENPGELGFKEGDNINLLSRIDENWFEGSVNGQTGFFPVNYVQVTVPLP